MERKLSMFYKLFKALINMILPLAFNAHSSINHINSKELNKLQQIMILKYKAKILIRII